MSTNIQEAFETDDGKWDGVIRAFWRRIQGYKKCEYNGIKELPDPLPVEFRAHFATALLAAPDVIKAALSQSSADVAQQKPIAMRSYSIQMEQGKPSKWVGSWQDYSKETIEKDRGNFTYELAYLSAQPDRTAALEQQVTELQALVSDIHAGLKKVNSSHDVEHLIHRILAHRDKDKKNKSEDEVTKPKFA